MHTTDRRSENSSAGTADVPTRSGTRSRPVALVHLARPRQWVKNVLVFAAPGAAGVLTQREALLETAIAFVCFCLAASGTYAWNDSLDVHGDRLHPRKRLRPVAAGEVSVRGAQVFGTVLLAAAIGLAFVPTWRLAAVVGGYVALTVTYSAVLKHIAVVDLAAVAAGFVLRTIAGGIAVGVPISEWFLIVAGAGALFVVTGKRQAEHGELGADAVAHRRALADYSLAYLSWVRAVTAGTAVVAYCLWAFERAPEVGAGVWFQLSIVPFVLAIMRYALLLDQGHGGAPEEVVLSDRTLQVLGLLWVGACAVAVMS